MNEDLWQIGKDIFCLISCALHGQCPPCAPESDLKKLYAFCQFHSTTAVVAEALALLWKKTPPEDAELAEKFRQAQAMSLRKSILLNAEREQVLAYLEQIGCWYMPLKGSLLQYDYPKLGMRQMSDNDVLIDASCQEQVHRFLCGRGYEAVSYQTTVENNYHKAPVYNFEMHTALFGMESPRVFREYYAGVKERLVPDDGKQYGYHFTADDFYIYMIAHAWKHAQRSGIGIRFLMDIWVWHQKHGRQLNEAYVEAELEKLGAAEFERSCRQLSMKLLAMPMETALSEEESKLLESFLTAGTYGTQEREMHNRLEKSGNRFGKLRYVWARLFPSAEELSLIHPHVMEQKWRVPFIWIWRFIRALFVSPVSTVKELIMLLKKRKKA